jgi:hypothetical protein
MNDDDHRALTEVRGMVVAGMRATSTTSSTEPGIARNRRRWPTVAATAPRSFGSITRHGRPGEGKQNFFEKEMIPEIKKAGYKKSELKAVKDARDRIDRQGNEYDAKHPEADPETPEDRGGRGWPCARCTG